MMWLRTVLDEFIGLFVDDKGFALAILAWVAIAAGLLPRLGLPGTWGAVVLALGLAAILFESALRRARRR